MYAWLVGTATRAVYAQLRRGRPGLILALAASDIHFRFPGDHSWAADYRSKDRFRAWLDRYLRVGLQLHAHEVAVAGPPWRLTVCTRFTDQARSLDGRIVYENEGVLVDRLVWGRLTEHISFEDTQKTVAFDAYLRSERPELASPA